MDYIFKLSSVTSVLLWNIVGFPVLSAILAFYHNIICIVVRIAVNPETSLCNTVYWQHTSCLSDVYLYNNHGKICLRNIWYLEGVNPVRIIPIMTFEQVVLVQKLLAMHSVSIYHTYTLNMMLSVVSG